MALLVAPPRPPRVALGDRSNHDRFRFRQWQMMVTTITVFVTGWFCTLGVIPAIIALMIAKHILVAVLVMGLGVDSREKWLR